jgi:four helix bundle protein
MAISVQLDVWKVAIELATEVHRIGGLLPDYERMGLADQLRRAASSIPANIAEGNARPHRREYLHYLAIARGSAAELHTHLTLARQYEYVPAADLHRAFRLLDRVGQMLTRLVKALRV